MVVCNIVWVLIFEGVGVFFFDFIGLGESEGGFVDINFFLNIEDLVQVVVFLVDEYEAFVLLIGYFFGGVVVLCVVYEIFFV